MNQIRIEQKIDLNIGIIEFKTYSINNEGLQEIYLAGWKADNNIKTYYLYENGLFDSSSIVIELFKDIFNYNKYTLYIHNLSKSNSILSLDSLTSLQTNYACGAIF